jgi:hypothetical protein
MAKHVTFWKMKVKPGHVDELKALMSDPAGEAEMNGRGWEMDITGISKNDPNEVWGCVTWDTSERYYANAESPEQNAMYEKMRGLLAEDPEWHDCDVLGENRA